jgi:hypothetical protein
LNAVESRLASRLVDDPGLQIHDISAEVITRVRCSDMKCGQMRVCTHTPSFIFTKTSRRPPCPSLKMTGS